MRIRKILDNAEVGGKMLFRPGSSLQIEIASMQVDLPIKLKAMLWDMPENQRMKIANEILAKPVKVFLSDDLIFIKALNSLKWYELIRLVGKQNLLMLLTKPTIQKLFPVQRRTYYTNAKRLLSKYAVPSSR